MHMGLCHGSMKHGSNAMLCAWGTMFSNVPEQSVSAAAEGSCRNLWHVDNMVVIGSAILCNTHCNCLGTSVLALDVQSIPSDKSGYQCNSLTVLTFRWEESLPDLMCPSCEGPVSQEHCFHILSHVDNHSATQSSAADCWDLIRAMVESISISNIEVDETGFCNNAINMNAFFFIFYAAQCTEDRHAKVGRPPAMRICVKNAAQSCRCYMLEFFKHVCVASGRWAFGTSLA